MTTEATITRLSDVTTADGEGSGGTAEKAFRRGYHHALCDTMRRLPLDAHSRRVLARWLDHVAEWRDDARLRGDTSTVLPPGPTKAGGR